jgi:hypothetical protein
MTKRTQDDPRKQLPDEEAALREQARSWHIDLFPEEYDHMYDSSADASSRRRGLNPMSSEYTAKVNARRTEMGFAPLTEAGDAPDRQTYDWVLAKLRSGEEAGLQAIKTERTERERAEAHRLEAERRALQTPDWQNRRIDEMLASDAYLGGDDDRNAPKVIAVRVLGEIFDMNPSGASEAPFLRQMHRILPGRTKAQYDNLYRHALREWVEIYGF